MGKMAEIAALCEAPTCVLVCALIDRTEHTNGLQHVPLFQLEMLRDNLSAHLSGESFGESMLLALVMLHYTYDTGEDSPVLFFDLLDGQTCDERDYFCDCDTFLYE